MKRSLVRKEMVLLYGVQKNGWINLCWNPTFGILKKDTNNRWQWLKIHDSLRFYRDVGKECTEIVFKVSGFSFRPVLHSLFMYFHDVLRLWRVFLQGGSPKYSDGEAYDGLYSPQGRTPYLRLLFWHLRAAWAARSSLQESLLSYCQ